ncbi:MAG: hypothetical protein AAGK22_01040 [Acidobacteriota bacterium]
MQNEDFDAIVIAFAASVGQGASMSLSGSAASFLSKQYIQLGKDKQDMINDEVHEACCRFFRALGSAAAVHANQDLSREITVKHLELAAEDLQNLKAGPFDCPLCPV